MANSMYSLNLFATTVKLASFFICELIISKKGNLYELRLDRICSNDAISIYEALSISLAPSKLHLLNEIGSTPAQKPWQGILINDLASCNFATPD